MSTSLPAALTAPPTAPRGALSPALAAQLDRVSDQGRIDRLLSQLDVNPIDTAGTPDPNQDALFSLSEDGASFVSFEGETL